MVNKNLIHEFKVLEYISDNQIIKNSIQLFIIFHLLDTTLGFLNILNKNFNIKSIIGIPYSANTKIVNKIENDINCPILIPNSIEEIEDIILKEFNNCNDKDPIIILEVGWYCAKIIDKLKSIKHNLIGVVEDTNQGHWIYESLSNLCVPVLSIAQSPIKDLENRLIGKAIVFSLENIIRKYFYYTFCGKNVLVFGYGKIGKSVAKTLKSRDCIVYVWDINPIKRIEARLDGFIVLKKEDMLKNSNVIVGVSGKKSISSKDFYNMKKGAIVCSGSSKQVEIDIEYLSEESSIESINKELSKVTLNNNVFFYLLNDGKPINFNDNSVLDSILDLIFSELFMCICDISNNKNQNGVKSLDVTIHEYICNIWENYYINEGKEIKIG